MSRLPSGSEGIVTSFDLHPAVCRVCEGPTRSGFALCFCCKTIVGSLQMPLAPVASVTSYRVGDSVHRLLRGYKDAPVAESRRLCATALSSLVETWLSAHHDRLSARFGPPWSAVVAVPSSRRPGAPVDVLAAMVPHLARWHRPLLVGGRGPMDHLQADRHGFEVAPDVDREWLRGRRTLVFDDSLVTGARVQSAVAALRSGGACVVGALVVGRVISSYPGVTDVGLGSLPDVGSGPRVAGPIPLG
jgi:hypothetical protein